MFGNKCFDMIKIKIKGKSIFIIAIVLAIAISIGIIIGVVYSKENSDNESTFGLWWWDNRLDSSYLDFACEKGINEIYYYTSSFSEKNSNFIKEANSKGIEVLWLAGKYEWIEDSSDLFLRIDEFLEFQKMSPYKFKGIHFDIEPHQHPLFEEKRSELLKKFINLTYVLRTDYPNLWIEYDIPLWFDDVILFDGTAKPVYEHIIDNASKITIMSYRDSSEEIYKAAEDEIDYALSVGKTLNLGVETGENDDDIVTFYEEGEVYMYNELSKLKEKLPQNFGIAIHHIKSWYNMKD